MAAVVDLEALRHHDAAPAVADAQFPKPAPLLVESVAEGHESRRAEVSLHVVEGELALEEEARTDLSVPGLLVPEDVAGEGAELRDLVDLVPRRLDDRARDGRLLLNAPKQRWSQTTPGTLSWIIWSVEVSGPATPETPPARQKTSESTPGKRTTPAHSGPAGPHSAAGRPFGN